MSDNTSKEAHYQVVTIGSATVDHFADTDSELIKIDTRTTHEALIAFPLGSKLLIKDLQVTTGGGGTNTAVSFARLGLKTGFLGKLGDDANAEFVLNKLRAESIDFLGGREGQTGFSVILNSIEQDRSILAYKGSNDHLKPTDVKPFSTDWFYISSMLGESLETVQKILDTSSGKVAFNPSNYQAEQGYKKLKTMLDKVTALIINREEACALLGLDYAEQRPVEVLLQELTDVLACEYILITDGKAGAWVCDGETVHHGLPQPDIRIKETTGAGDAFASTFTGAMIKGLALPQALDYAMTNAESVLQFRGAKECLLSWDALSAQVKAKPRELSQTPLYAPVS